MKTVTATTASLKFSEVLESSQHEDVGIKKNGRPVAVIMAWEDAVRFRDEERAKSQEYVEFSPETTELLRRDIERAKSQELEEWDEEKFIKGVRAILAED